MAPHSGILAWRIPLTEEAGRLQSMESQESGRAEQLRTLTEPHDEHSSQGGRLIAMPAAGLGLGGGMYPPPSSP